MSKKNMTINDYIVNDTGYKSELDPIMGSGEVATTEYDEFIFDEGFNSKLLEYNTKVTKIDPIYSNVEPFGYKMIVRAFCDVAQVTESGLKNIPVKYVSANTSSGYGKIYETPSQHPYQNLVVVIAVGNHITNVSPGDILQISAEKVMTKSVGVGDNVKFFVPSGYVHPNSGYDDIPYDPTDPHYGYLLVDYSDILTRIKKYGS
jgi:hypothetical protein